MRWNRLGALLTALMMILMIAMPASAYTAGTYTAEGMGNNGAVKVQVTFTDDAIERVEVIEHAETAGLSDPAIERIPDGIVAAQSLAVDTVSGATNTSKAILNAVEACVVLAGGDVEALKAATASGDVAEGDVVELSTDLVVVGGGGAGMTATINARANGIDVILLEKMSFMGGATSICGGAMIITGSQMQRDFGVDNDTPETLYADNFANGKGLNDPEKLKLYTENVGETADWLRDVVGVGFKDIGYQAEHSIDRVANFEGSAAGLTKTLREQTEASGATIMLETRGEALIMEDGAVVGVTARGADGTVYNIRAGATLLTTGGFGANQDLLPDALKPVLYYGPPSSTGDGHLMAESAGAQFQMMEYGKIYPNGVEIAPHIGKSTINANRNAIDVSGIIVGKDGNRLWNERGTNKDLYNVQHDQPDQTMYFFMDQASFDAFKTGLANTGITEANVEEWLANNGAVPPLFAHGETVDEVAAIAGIDAAALRATIERFNGFVEAGVDEDFGRPAAYLTTKIGEGPYYIVEQKPRFATTLGGVKATNDFEIIDADGAPIPGLYAAGELIGGVQGADSPPGSNVGWALTSGRMVGEALAQLLKK